MSDVSSGDAQPADGAPPHVAVGIIAICSAVHVARCLEALRAQRNAPEFDVVVACDPGIQHLDGLVDRYPEARLVVNEGQRSPLELASVVIRESRGDILLLTEDHCVPAPDWVRTMVDAHRNGRTAVGGRVELNDEVSAVDWAFYFVDFFRYTGSVGEGPARWLTVCNVSYKRPALEEVSSLWSDSYHETVVNAALRRIGEGIWLLPASEVVMLRHVRFADALHERYAFARLFGQTRLERVGRLRGLYYTLFAPCLPILILARMAKKALESRRLTLLFLRALGPIALMVLWWSWGEWLGYLTRRGPGSLVVAPEIGAPRRGGRPGRSPGA